LAKGVAGFVVGHASDLREGKGAGGGGEEEVLSHLSRPTIFVRHDDKR